MGGGDGNAAVRSLKAATVALALCVVGTAGLLLGVVIGNVGAPASPAGTFAGSVQSPARAPAPSARARQVTLGTLHPGVKGGAPLVASVSGAARGTASLASVSVPPTAMPARSASRRGAGRTKEHPHPAPPPWRGAQHARPGDRGHDQAGGTAARTPPRGPGGPGGRGPGGSGPGGGGGPASH
jgi:translation initiation factor IF-2